MDEQQRESARYNLTVLNRWHAYDEEPKTVSPYNKVWSEEALDEHFRSFFLEGPTNIHQITLADALLSTWNNYPQLRSFCAANILCFTAGASPK